MWDTLQNTIKQYIVTLSTALFYDVPVTIHNYFITKRLIFYLRSSMLQTMVLGEQLL